MTKGYKGGTVESIKSMIGQKYGRWTVVSYFGTKGTKARVPHVNCRCECGTERVVAVSNLRTGLSKSCGCLHREVVKSQPSISKKMGFSRQQYRRAYATWRNMINRCSNPDRKDFRYWGGRGIKVCDRWQVFHNFLEDMGPAPKGLSLDRIDVNGNYEHSNCRWTDAKTQASNQRDRLVAKHFADFNERARAAICMVV